MGSTEIPTPEEAPMSLQYRYDANGRQVGVTTEAGRAAVAEAERTDVWCTCPDPEPVPYTSDGPLGHGWDCGLCGKLYQVG